MLIVRTAFIVFLTRENCHLEVSTALVDAGVKPLSSVTDAGMFSGNSDAGQQVFEQISDGGIPITSQPLDASVGAVEPGAIGNNNDAGSTTTGTLIPSSFQYVENAGFEDYLVDDVTGQDLPTGWTFESTSAPSCEVDTPATFDLISTNDAQRLRVLEIDHSTLCDHWAMMGQTREVSVGACDTLILSGEVKPIGQGLSGPGTSQGQFPAHLRVLYTDATGTLNTFQVGVYFNGEDISSFEVLECASELGHCLDIQTHKTSQNNWYTLPEIDLMALTPQPKQLRAFYVGSSGTSFKARFDNIQVTGTGAQGCGVDSADTPTNSDGGL